MFKKITNFNKTSIYCYVLSFKQRPFALIDKYVNLLELIASNAILL